MSSMYGVDFEQFRGLCYVMIATGGVCAAIDFLYQIITVLRRQKAVTRVYLLTLGFSLIRAAAAHRLHGPSRGAVPGYLIVMCIASRAAGDRVPLKNRAELSETLIELPQARRPRHEVAPEHKAALSAAIGLGPSQKQEQTTRSLGS